LFAIYLFGNTVAFEDGCNCSVLQFLMFMRQALVSLQYHHLHVFLFKSLLLTYDIDLLVQS